MEEWAKEYLQLVDDCEARESRLTEWERGFLGSIRSLLENGIKISTKQIEKLDEIWERVTAKG